MTLTKADKSYLKKVATRVAASHGRKVKYAKKTLAEYREYLSDRGYEPDEIENMTRDGAKRWQDEQVRRVRDTTRVRYTKRAVYVYKHVDDRGRAVAGRWYTHKNYAKSVRTAEYWRDVKRLTSIYQFPLVEARGLYKRLHDPRLTVEFRQELWLLVSALIESPDFVSGAKKGKVKSARRGNREKSLKVYWKTIRRMAAKKSISIKRARKLYSGGVRVK